MFIPKPKRFLLLLLSLILSSTISLWARSSLDSLRQLTNNSEGNLKVVYSIKLAKKLIEYSKISEGIGVASEVLSSGKESGNIEHLSQAYSILSRGYLLAGDISSSIAYGDSLMTLARKNNYQYGLALAYQAVGVPQMYLGDPQAGIASLDSSLNIFNIEQYPLERATSFLLIASIYATTGQAEASFPYLKDAKEIFAENNDSYKTATIQLNEALIRSTTLGQYEEAINSSLEVLPYFESVKDSLKIAICESTIANCYDAIGNYDKAIEYYESAISMMGVNGNIIMKANFMNNLGEVYKHKEDYDKAYEYYYETLSIFNQYGINEGVIVAENNIGECFLVKGEYDKALMYFQQSLKKIDKQNDFYKLAILYNNIGKVHLGKKNSSKAIPYFNKSIASGNKLDLLEEIFPAYENLAKAYEMNGNYKEAYLQHKKYAEVKDEFTKASNAEKISDIDTKYQTVKKEKEIELLTKGQEIQELQLSNQRIITILLVVASVLIGLFSIVIFKRYKDNQKLNEALEIRNKQIETQKNELKTINEQLTYSNERLQASETDLKALNATKDKFFSIIAHDLKGPFSSLLGYTEIMAQDTDTMSVKEIKEMSEGINTASKKVYALTENLLEWSRTQLDMLNIKREIFDFNELVNSNARLYRNSLNEKRIILNKDLCDNSMINTDRDMVDFALRNLINNAIKFTAHEGEIKITSAVEKDYLRVEISDTGIGIPEEAIENLFKIESTFSTSGTDEEKGTGLGLILVKEFIDKIGGAIFVDSKVNSGTTFTFTLPLAA